MKYVIYENRSGNYYISRFPNYDIDKKPVSFHGVSKMSAMRFSLKGAFGYLKRYNPEILEHYSHRKFQHIIMSICDI